MHYVRTITRDVIIGGGCYQPGDVVRVSANTLRQLIEELAVDPHEILRRMRPADQRRCNRRCRRRVV